MSALPRPDTSPGAHRELVAALHDLHHRAGWPSLRRMATAVGASHTTVSRAFSSPSLPAWGTLELLVETLGGDVSTFHDLWLRASTPADASIPPVARIAGRRVELATVRRHLETGSGLLLVTGEAGLGKTRLVGTGAEVSDVLVAVGHCLPLSAQAPLMPVGEALRGINDLDGGRRLREALAVAPTYVRDSLARLLPELSDGHPPEESTDEFARQQLFAAASTCLSNLHALGGLGLLLEDLHWADTATLDLLEHLVVGGLAVPVVATWRLDDPDVGDPQRDWWLRVRRIPAVRTLDLRPLTREESGEQCRLLGLQLDEASIDSIHGRSRGQPLFTEQLAAHAPGDTALPVVLADLLDHRLDRLDESAHVITRVLGLADRGLAPAVLAAATGLEEVSLVRGLRELARTHLLAPPTASGAVQLRHPLLAAAVRRRLVAGETPAVHRRLAEAMSAEPEETAAEVAEHWRGAGDHERELECRITAARDAGAQWAATQAAAHWLRALEVWPRLREWAGDPPVSRAEAYLAAMDALKDSLQFERAAAMSADAAERFPDVEPALRAEFLRRAAAFRTDLEGPEVGLELVEEAIEILSALPVGMGMVRAMARKHQVLLRLGRYAEAVGVARAAVAAAVVARDHQSQRVMLAHVAWHEAVVDGQMERANATMARARSVSTAEDPTGHIWLAVIWTDVLLILGADPAEIVAAGREALVLADERGIADFGPVLVRTNMVQALVDHGRVAEARALLVNDALGEVDLDRAPLFVLRARLDALAGHLDEASRTVDALVHGMAMPSHDLDFVQTVAAIDLWRHRPREAWSRVLAALEAKRGSPPALLMPPLVLLARAGADLAAGGGADARARRTMLAELRARAATSTSTSLSARALSATWVAELARLEGEDSARLWHVADSEWRTLARPHDAAYCRWRAAQVAIRDGQRTAATRLLARAANDARGHEPLVADVEATTASLRRAQG